MAGHRHLLFEVLAVLYLTGLCSGELVTKCKTDDAKCMKGSAQTFIPTFAAGIPEHHVKTLDPVSFKKIDASSPNLKLILTDITITGLKNSVMKNVKIDPAGKKLLFKIQCSAQLEGQYVMKGQLLILPIEGSGPLHVTLRKAEFNLDVDMGEKEKNGVKHWDIKGWKHTFTLKEKSDVVFENLFNGNEVLGQAAREVISTSGNEVILEVGSPVMKAVVDEVVTNVKAFFDSVPMQDLSVV